MRLIDADELLERMKKTPRYFTIKFDVEQSPTIETDIEVVAKDAYEQGYTDGWKERFGEPDERPNAKWILKETEYDAGGTLYECTNCHHSDVHAESVEVPFCWYCGARMRGTENEKI